MSDYIFDKNAEDRELGRLRLIEAAVDADTIDLLEETRCRHGRGRRLLGGARTDGATLVGLLFDHFGSGLYQIIAPDQKAPKHSGENGPSSLRT